MKKSLVGVWVGIFLAAVSMGHAAVTDATPATSPAGDRFEIGQAMPPWESLDDQGKAWKSAEHVGNKVIVLYFYPGDFTGGCIRQAQAFREGLGRLENLDVEVIGVSGDDVATHKLFKESHGLKHTLLADPEGKLAKLLGAPIGKGAKVRTRDLTGKPLIDEKGKSIFVQRSVTLPRWTIIIGSDGKVVSKRTEVKPATDAEEVIKIVESLAK